jgi:hypothetical protein
MDLTPVPNDFEVWHLAAALPLGVLCAVVGSSVLVLNLMVPGIRQRLSRGMVNLALHVWLISIFFRLSAGLVHGLLGLYFYAMGTGLSFSTRCLECCYSGRDATMMRSVVLDNGSGRGVECQPWLG